MTTIPQEDPEEPFFRAYLSPSTLRLLRDLAGRIGCDDPEELTEELLLPGLQAAVREQDALCRCVADGLGPFPDTLSPADRYPTAAALRPALIEMITRAFDGVERGSSGPALHEADYWDFGGNLAEARLKDTDTRWQDVTDAAIEDCQTALGIVDAAGFRYYLPAYMIWTLNYYHTPGLTLINLAIYCLHPRDTSDLAAFTPAQAEATACFLRFMARNDGQVDSTAAQKALEGYWGQFCPSDPV